MTGQRIFISHASENADVADRIVAYLEGRGVPCWISSRDIPPKEIYAEAITQAMRDAQSCVVIVSAASNASVAVKRELELASRYNKPFIPIRLDATEPGPGLDYYLNNTQWVDYGRDRERGLDRIVGTYTAQTGGAPHPPLHPHEAPPPKKYHLLRTVFISAAVGGILAIAYSSANYLIERSQQGQQRAAFTQIAGTLAGAYVWDNIACGQGPTVALDGDELVFTMAGTPTYRHQVIGAARDVDGFDIAVTTRVVEPADARGDAYGFTLNEGASELAVNKDGEVNVWRRCDSQASAPPPMDLSLPDFATQHINAEREAPYSGGVNLVGVWHAVHGGSFQVFSDLSFRDGVGGYRGTCQQEAANFECSSRTHIISGTIAGRTMSMRRSQNSSEIELVRHDPGPGAAIVGEWIQPRAGGGSSSIWTFYPAGQVLRRFRYADGTQSDEGSPGWWVVEGDRLIWAIGAGSRYEAMTNGSRAIQYATDGSSNWAIQISRNPPSD